MELSDERGVNFPLILIEISVPPDCMDLTWHVKMTNKGEEAGKALWNSGFPEKE